MGSIGEALGSARAALSSFPTASLDSQLLMGHVLAKPRSWVLAHVQDPLSEADQSRFAELVNRRSKGEPVAYIRGWIEWLDMRLEISPDVLVPRPETELLVEKAIDVAREISAVSIVDVGTGSGSIAIAMARALPEAAVYATDVSEVALRLAARNARYLQISERVTFLTGNLLDPLTDNPDLIVANLPYLSTDMMNMVEAPVRHEPKAALHGGSSGLELYRELFHQMRDRRLRIPAVIEVDPRQAAAIKELTGTLLPGAHLEILQDYAGHDRVVVVRS